jgi:general secretion pathway protein A
MCVTSDDRQQSVPADPGVLLSLSDLDRALGEGSTPIPVPAGERPAPHRPLLDLFPSDDDPIGQVQRTDSLSSYRTESVRIDPAGYETFYGLHEPPFALSSDPRFLYHSAAHDRAAQQMLDAIRARDGIVVLTGEAGVGKTMLCRAVMEHLDRRTLTSFISEAPPSTEDLLRTVLVDFGVMSRTDAAGAGVPAREDLLSALRTFLLTLAPLQAFAAVIVDEAQHLSSGVLADVRLLADTGVDQRLLQVILVGQPVLAGALAHPALREVAERIALRCRLDPLEPDEVPGYVAHRLAVAGGHTRVEFEDSAVDRIGALSRGVPRIVNLLCDRALAAGFRETSATIDDRLVDQAADEIDLAVPLSRWARARRVFVTVLLVLLALAAGAAGAAYVFRADVAALVSQWQGKPAPQSEPAVPPPPPAAPRP